MLIAVEGLDGAGKNTLVRGLVEATGADVLAFPRYGESVHAQLAAEALHGRMGDLTDSAYAMATLFALDRHGALDRLRAASGHPAAGTAPTATAAGTAPAATAAGGVLICDRYVASNAAYSWARTGDEAVVDWVEDLEFSRLGLPRPDLTVLLDTDPATAAERARGREAADASRTRDRYERDSGLQERTWQAYLRLADRRWGGPWLVTSDPAKILAAAGLG
ncbi:thymidylate kinase [Corynebacterium frankenforstense DSM 45800]|uniref:Thymidylate kinase n=1 Tax=Corynebacterium frankenforstense DSM 45800 TaxID=1437875 RepID=A0A1L7CRE0_9CORY|nr:dTMP kinase [Corynebacterium frankenforstense]APT88413.1 thymidylate kinase [Corynebacterium frankenforstense DSM 45800]